MFQYSVLDYFKVTWFLLNRYNASFLHLFQALNYIFKLAVCDLKARKLFQFESFLLHAALQAWQRMALSPQPVVLSYRFK